MIDSTNRNTALASALVEELARCGVERAIVSPGSRSSPVALALDREPGISVSVVLDERAAGFMALGASLSSGPAGGRRLHERLGGRQPASGGRRGRPGRDAADPADLRPPARAARDRRRSGDRSDQALRRRRPLVLRGRQPRGRRRRAAALPLDRLPRPWRGGRRPRARAPQPGLARSARSRSPPRRAACRRAACPRRALRRASAYGADLGAGADRVADHGTRRGAGGGETAPDRGRAGRRIRLLPRRLPNSQPSPGCRCSPSRPHSCATALTIAPPWSPPTT